MPRFTVVTPTFDHGPLIGHALRSVQRQTVADFEVIVVGEGASEETKAAVAPFLAQDRRIRFLDLPRPPGRTVGNRAAGVDAADSEFVAYIDDDDLWLPDHLEVLGGLLAQADLAHTRWMAVVPWFRLNLRPYGIGQPRTRERLQAIGWNCFAPTQTGHRLAAYRSLPSGWEEPPPGVWNDLNMWRKFLAAPGLRFAHSERVTAIHLPTSGRKDWTPADRLSEIRFWSALIRRPEVLARLRALPEARDRLDLPGVRAPWDMRTVEMSLLLGMPESDDDG